MIKQMTESQELARHFNADEAVWERYEERKRLRPLRGVDSQVLEDFLDELDWLEAGECREIRCVASDPSRTAPEAGSRKSA